MANYASDQHAKRRAAFLWKEHLSVSGMRGEERWAVASALRDNMRDLVTDSAFLGSLSSKDLLRVAHLVSRYRPVTPHAFVLAMAMTVDDHEKQTKQG